MRRLMGCRKIALKTSMFLVGCWVIALGLNAPCAMGAETGDGASQTDVQKLAPLTVTGLKRSTRPDLQPDSLTNPYRTEASTEFATEVFTREDIKNFKPKDLNDLIDKAAGIDITYQGRKYPYIVRQRGVLADGSLDDANWYYDPLTVRLLSADAHLKWTQDQVTLFNVFKTDYEQHEHNEYFSATSVTDKEAYTEETSGFVVAVGAHWQVTDRITLDGRYFYGDQGISGDFDMRLENDATPHAQKQDRIEIGLGGALASFFTPTLTWFHIDTENEKNATTETYETDTGTYYYTTRYVTGYYPDRGRTLGMEVSLSF